MYKVSEKQQVKNAIGNDCVQSVTLEREEDGTDWSIINHDGNEISLSKENLIILFNNINIVLKASEKWTS